MNTTPTRPKRSPLVVVLDAVLGMAAAVQTGATPEPRVRPAGEPARRRATFRIMLAVSALLAISGTALLVVLVVRQTDRAGLAPDKAGALPGVRSSAVAPAAAGATSPATDAGPAPGPTTPRLPVLPPAVAPSDGSSPAASSAPGGGVIESTAVPLTASYRTTPYVAGLLGYRVTATIENPGSAARDGWQLSITLPRSTLRVTTVSGATAAQDKAVWTFTPDASTASIPAGGEAQVVFEVHGATLIDAAPRACRINDQACAA